MEFITVQNFALRYEPPTLIVEYIKTGFDFVSKSYLKRIRIKNINQAEKIVCRYSISLLK
jgi:hypothetical protein